MTRIAVPRAMVWLRLLWMFLKVNILSPSGPASIGLLYKEAVAKRLMTEAQFVEAVGFSNVLPGSEALKLAMFVGFAAGGIPGVLTALLGAILPPTVMMLIVAALLQRFQHSEWISGFVTGMSPAVAALIAVVAWELFRATSPRRIDRHRLPVDHDDVVVAHEPVVAQREVLQSADAGQHQIAERAGDVVLLAFDQRHPDGRIGTAQVLGAGGPRESASDHNHACAVGTGAGRSRKAWDGCSCSQQRDVAQKPATVPRAKCRHFPLPPAARYSAIRRICTSL